PFKRLYGRSHNGDEGGCHPVDKEGRRMNDYDRIAPFYDIEHAQFDADLDMYRNFAQLWSGPLLELACGSGRLLLPLARDGYELTGVDSSATMLKLAQEALEQVGLTERCRL